MFRPSYPGGPYANRYRSHTAYRDQQLFRIVLALAQQIYFMPRKPPVTILLVIFNVLIYLKPTDELHHLVPSIRSGCLNPSAVLYNGQFERLFWSQFLHATDLHLYYNMVSLLYKGSQLEPSLGSLKFFALVSEISFFSSVSYILASFCLASSSSGAIWSAILSLLPSSLSSFLFPAQSLFSTSRYRNSFFRSFFRSTPDSLLSSCAVGFSGVLFGLKVVLNHNSSGWTDVGIGIRLPTKYAAWAELLIIQLITPNVSFLGHLCGIAAGLMHVYVTRPILWNATVSSHWWMSRWWHVRNRNSSRREYGSRSQRGPRFYGRGTWGE